MQSARRGLSGKYHPGRPMTSPTPSPEPAPEPTRPRSRARRIFRFFFLLGLISILTAALSAGLAPVLLSTGPGRAAALSVANRFLPVEVAVSRLDVSWRSGIHARDVRIGREGEDPFEVDSLRASVRIGDLIHRRIVAHASVAGLRGSVTRRADDTFEGGGREWRPAPRPPSEIPGDEGAAWSVKLHFELKDAEVRLVDEKRGSEATIGVRRLSALADHPSGEIRLETEGSVHAASLAGAFEVDGRFDPGNGTGRGNLRAEGIDLASLSPFLAAGTALANLEGIVEGSLAFASEGGWSGSGEWRARGLRLPGRRESGFPDLFEEEARLEFAGSFDPESDRLVLDRAEITTRTNGVRLGASGTIEEASSARLLAGSIDLEADGESLRRAGGEALPAEMRLRGPVSANLSLGGSVEDLEGLTASGTLVLPDVDYGENTLREGRAEIAVSGRAVRLRELRGTWNDGEVVASGLVDLSGEAPRLALDAKATDVRIVRELILPLAHVLPILATTNPQVVRVSIPFSGELRVGGAGGDLASLERTVEGEGRVELRSGTLTGSPDVLPFLRAVGGRDRLEFEGISTSFRIAQGRITTDALRIGRGDAVVTLSGSTGLDGTLDYRIAVDLSEKLERRRWAAALEGMFGAAGLPVALGGRVNGPRLEFRPLDLQDVAGDAAREGARSLLDEILRRRRDKK